MVATILRMITYFSRHWALGVALLVTMTAFTVTGVMVCKERHRDYLNTSGQQQAARKDWQAAIRYFSAVEHYKDSKRWIARCRSMQLREQEAQTIADERQRAAYVAEERERERRRLMELVNGDVV